MSGRLRQLKVVLDYCYNNSSVGGVSNIRENQSKIWKLFWTLLVLLGKCFTVVSIVLTIQDFMSNRTVTSVKTTFERNMTFPALTLCNANSVRKDGSKNGLMRIAESPVRLVWASVYPREENVFLLSLVQFH